MASGHCDLGGVLVPVDVDVIKQGDSIAVLKEFPDNYFHSVVTDPPYGLAFMGKKWDYDVPSVELWREVLRVLKPGGQLLSFGGTRTYHRMVVNIEDAGFEIRDQLQWIYGSGFPKSTNIASRLDKEFGGESARGKGFNVAGQNVQLNQNKELRSDHPNYVPPEYKTDAAKQWQGWGTALKPAQEIICLARKPLTTGSLLTNLVLQCQSKLLALIAKKYSASNPSVSSAAASIALWNAEKNTLTRDALCEVTATLQSESEKCLNLSIELSWLDILDDTLKLASTFTTGTESSLTIDLKILNSYLSRIMPESTLQNAGLGEQSNALTVQSLLNALEQKLNFIQTPSVHDLAISEDISLSPNSEPIVLARKPIDKGLTVAENVLKHGVGGLNVDASRIEGRERTDYGLKNSVRNNLNAYGADGTAADFDSSKGRWPANVLFDEDAAAGLGEPSRFFYVAKASKRERNAGLEGIVKEKQGARPNSKDASGKFPDHDHRPSGGNNHPTVKPVKLMEYLVRMVTPPGGIVLDPFCGSGTTGVACKNLDFGFVGIEREAEYAAIARKRTGA